MLWSFSCVLFLHSYHASSNAIFPKKTKAMACDQPSKENKPKSNPSEGNNLDGKIIRQQAYNPVWRHFATRRCGNRGWQSRTSANLNDGTSGTFPAFTAKLRLAESAAYSPFCRDRLMYVFLTHFKPSCSTQSTQWNNWTKRSINAIDTAVQCKNAETKPSRIWSWGDFCQRQTATLNGLPGPPPRKFVLILSCQSNRQSDFSIMREVTRGERERDRERERERERDRRKWRYHSGAQIGVWGSGFLLPFRTLRSIVALKTWSRNSNFPLHFARPCFACFLRH